MSSVRLLELTSNPDAQFRCFSCNGPAHYILVSKGEKVINIYNTERRMFYCKDCAMIKSTS